MSENFCVQIEEFAERHFIKSFEKKYKKKWEVTFRAIKEEFARIDALLLTSKAEIITDAGDIKIIKTKFRVVDTKESATSSGNRCIVAWCKSKHAVSVLLVYSKTDLRGGTETAEWKRIIRDTYPEYSTII